MKKILLVSFALIAAAVAAWTLRGGSSGAPAPLPPAAQPRAVLPALAAAAAPPSATQQEAVADAALLVTPEARAWTQREEFNQRARDFFAAAAQLAPAQREREARELDAAVDSYERSRHLSAGEAMTLRIGLIQATTEDEVLRADRIAALVARYEADGQRREAQWAAQLQGDAGFMRYKQREAVIVAEVMALAQIPGGLTRDEYLRQRLQAERVTLMP